VDAPTSEDLLSLFPPGTHLDGDGMLTIGGCRLDGLAETFGTPAIIVDEPALRRRARDYRETFAARWPRSEVMFASKAFPCTAVQRLVTEEGLGLDVAGGGEMVTAFAAGADPARMLLHGNAKTDEEIQLALRHGIGRIVVDNQDDIDRLEAAVPAGTRQPVLVRVIPGVDAPTHAAIATGHDGSKFGLTLADARRAIARIKASRALRMDGLHMHIGSQILDVESFAAAVAALAALTGELGEFDVYDLGGGLGARYTYRDQPPSLDAYLDAVVGAARAHLPAGALLLLEPGRSLVASAAATIYRVVTVKRGARTFVAVDGGMADNLEVSLYGQRFEATLADRVGGGEPVDLVGRHCESGDVLSSGVPLRDPRRGDLVAVPATGAYCHTMSNTYNGARRIPVVFAGDGGARLVVRRDTWGDLLARDVASPVALPTD
jgi:diaminopimelate decarboxylase